MCGHVTSATVLKYFKRKDGLPDLKGPLSQSVSLWAVAAANAEVTKVVAGASGTEQGEYRVSPRTLVIAPVVQKLNFDIRQYRRNRKKLW